MSTIPRSLIAEYNHASMFMHGRVSFGSPEWIDPSSYFDESTIIEGWGSRFGNNDTIDVESYSVFLDHVESDDPYHDDRLIIDVTVE